ncbi:hypothetical protein Q9L58_006972 [Maublancomyces gigas]|uniref:Uncharacterized protein n=1 Tax=Discina gigas TaxID=1032678 RepID=A0ABR3GDS5_9PEZI
MFSVINSTPAPQPDVPDVHTLVAFAAFAANQTPVDPPKPHFSSWKTNIFDKPLILDAIAAICVTERRPEPAAVALAIDTKLHQVRLLITQGGVTQPDERLLSHICKIWGLLQRHSKQALKNRRQSLGQVGLTKPEQCLHRHIYLAKRVVVMKVIGKWWPMLDAADRQLGRSRRASGEKVLQSSPMSPFRHALLSLRKAVRIMGQDLSLLSLESWQQVVSLMDAASGHFRAMVNQCRRRGGSYKDYGGCEPFQARTALENLTSLHGKILTLTTFASSPCPSDIFTFKLQVSFLTCPSRLIPLPTNWTPAIESISICHYHTLGSYYAQITGAPGFSAIAGELAAAYATPQRGAPHPECYLISYLHTRRGRATSPLGYIGLSAPACAACYKWIALYSSHKTQRFRHRGSTNTWSWPWVLMPGVDESDMAKCLMYCCHRWLRDHKLVG